MMTGACAANVVDAVAVAVLLYCRRHCLFDVAPVLKDQIRWKRRFRQSVDICGIIYMCKHVRR